jgi:glycosyltransferase involved in cell wall biosynthesis
MGKLLIITGDRSLAEGKRGALYNTMEEFHKYWDRIDVIVPKVQNSNFKFQSLFGNIFFHPSPWPLLMQPFWILKKGKQIYREQNFNLMTVHEYPPFYNGIGAKLLHRKTKVPYVLEIMHVPGHPKSANFRELFYKLLVQLFVRFTAADAQAVRIINKKETGEFLLKNGIPREKLVYIPAFYIDLEIFRPMNIIKEYKLIFIGRLAKNKGINLFLEAVRKLKVRAIIIGDGPLRNWVQSKIRDWGLEKYVNFYGWARDSKEIAQLINKSEILIMPSYNEGGPRVVLEAMACGIPVLATPVGIVPDVIKDGESGRVIEWNAKDIANKAAELLNDENKCRNFGLNGLNIVQQFEKKRAIKNYADKLKEMLR